VSTPADPRHPPEPGRPADTGQPRDVESLLGAYALDALEPDERALVERYIAQHPRARAEVDELRETAAILAAAPVAGTSAPPELWTRIARAVGATDGAQDELARRRGRVKWITTAVAAIATAAAIVLAVVAVSLNNDLDEARQPGDEQIAAAFEHAVDVDGARQVELDAARGDARIVVLPDGKGYIVADGLPALDEAETYQLWAVTGEGSDQHVISAGVLGADPEAASFVVNGPVSAFAITVEAAGGVPVSEKTPIASGNLA
jgi:anti-sigma-K factor RskA